MSNGNNVPRKYTTPILSVNLKSRRVRISAAVMVQYRSYALHLSALSEVLPILTLQHKIKIRGRKILILFSIGISFSIFFSQKVHAKYHNICEIPCAFLSLKKKLPAALVGGLKTVF
uniref:Uncharacterized protein n=1 Tax=Cacopsylla melanoneura TaxID=428564 RepID=A0A8D8RGB6_9HEMI